MLARKGQLVLNLGKLTTLTKGQLLFQKFSCHKILAPLKGIDIERERASGKLYDVIILDTPYIYIFIYIYIILTFNRVQQ